MKYIISVFVFSLFFFACEQEKKTTEQDSTQAKTAEELVQAGDQYSRLGTYEKAIEAYESAYAKDSLNPIILHKLADAQLDYYLSRDALKTMEKAAELFPDRLETLIKLSEVYFILKQYDETMSVTADILNKDPDFTEAYFMRGLTRYEMGDKEKALSNFQRATELNSDHRDAWMMLGTVYSDLGDDKALQCFDNVLLIDPEAVEALHNKAFHLQNTDRIEEAKKLYRSINEKNPQYTDAYFNTGILYLEQDSLQEALDHFRIAYKTDPSYAMAYYYSGVTLEKLGQPDKAIEMHEQAVRLVPEFVRANEALKYLKAKQEL